MLYFLSNIICVTSYKAKKHKMLKFLRKIIIIVYFRLSKVIVIWMSGIY